MDKIEKLELRHLRGYPMNEATGLLIQTNKRKATRSGQKIGYYTGRMIGLSARTGVEIVFDVEDFAEDFDLNEISPILLPLSALTEPLPDGTVPIVELAKIAGFKDFEVLQVKEGSTAYIATLSDNFIFMVLKSNCDFAICAGKEITFLPSQLQLFEYLYSIHVDIYGLIPAGLAIDKRTVKL